MLKKGFSIILVIVIALVVIAGGVLALRYWPEPVEQGPTAEDQGGIDQLIVNEETDEIAGWQTYRNEEYGYTIKYPLGYEISDSTNPERVVFRNIKQAQLAEERRAGEVTSLSVNVYRNDKELGLQEWLNENLSIYLGFPPDMPDTLVDFNDISIDGVNGLQFTEQSMGAPRYTLIPKDDIVIDIRVFVFAESNAYNDYNQLVSTFRFLD